MSKSYVQDQALEETSYQLASALGLSKRSAGKAIKKLAARCVSDSDKVFAFEPKGTLYSHVYGGGLYSVEDIVARTGLKLDHIKQRLITRWGLDTVQGRYYSVLPSWQFQCEG